MKSLTAAGGVFVFCLVLSAGARAGDVTAGKAIFDKTCANCHSTEAGVNKVGPTLFDIVGRPVASVHGYDYSKKMRAIGKEGKVWDDKRLDNYLTNPRQVLHGVKMFFSLPDAKDRADVIAYLNTLK